MTIKSITVEINGNDVVMSLEAARALFNDLSEIFAKPVPMAVWPNGLPNSPLPTYKPFEITCNTVFDGKDADDVVSSAMKRLFESGHITDASGNFLDT